MNSNSKFFFFNFQLFILLLFFSACTGGRIESDGLRCDSDSIKVPREISAGEVVLPSEVQDETLPTQAQIDSLRFRLTHHYSVGFNFVIDTDSLLLIPGEGETVLTDTCVVRDGDLVVVADWRTVLAADSAASDTVWVKVARDQTTMGWVMENELLENACPDDPISAMLRALTLSRVVWMSVLIVIGLLTLWKSRKFDIHLRSPYPSLLTALVGIEAALYASVQNFVPEYWLEFYFHPSMNPLMLPPILAILIMGVWLLLIVSLATLIEVYDHLKSPSGLIYVMRLAGAEMMVYLVIAYTTRIYVGYALLLALLVLLTYKLARQK